MQFFFCSAFLLYFCEIHRVDRGEGHVGHALIVRVGSVHAVYFEMMLSSSKYFSFIRLRANAPPTADKNPIEIASRRNNLIIFFSMVVFLCGIEGASRRARYVFLEAGRLYRTMEHPARAGRASRKP